MALLIRPLAAGDTPAVIDFFAGAAGKDSTVDAISASAWEHFLRIDVNAMGGGFLVAEDDGALVAVATSSLRRPGHEVVRHFRIVVDPAARRRGIGRRVLSGLVALDTEEPGLVLQSLCKEEWSDGRAFLESMGFEVVEEELEMECARAPPPPPRAPGLAVERAEEAGAFGAEVARLHNLGYADDVSFVSYSADAMARLLADGAELWLARRDGEIVGFCHLEPDQGAMWIESLVVAPSEKGRGVAKALGARVVRDILEQRGRTARLQVSSRNESAIGLYRRLGFEKVGASLRYRAPRETLRAALGEAE